MAVPFHGVRGQLGFDLGGLEDALRGLPVAETAFGAALAACLTSGGRDRTAGVSAAARGALQVGPSALAPDPVAGSLIVQLEDVLFLAGRLAGTDAKRNITEAKRLLRLHSRHGGASLASRVGRLSKGRNALAHPDVGLMRDIEQLFRWEPCPSADSENGRDGAVSPRTLGTKDPNLVSLASDAPHFDGSDQLPASIGSPFGQRHVEDCTSGTNNKVLMLKPHV